MWGRLGRRKRRTRREEAVEQAIGALENVRGRFGRSRTRRGGRAYGDAVGLGAGVVLTVLVLSLLYWRFRRTAGETTSAIPAPEEGVEAASPGREAIPLGPPREEPPPGEERPERRGVTPTAPPILREEPPPGEEQPERRTP